MYTLKAMRLRCEWNQVRMGYFADNAFKSRRDMRGKSMLIWVHANALHIKHRAIQHGMAVHLIGRSLATPKTALTGA